MARVDPRLLRAKYLPQNLPDTPDTCPDNGQERPPEREKLLSGTPSDTYRQYPTLAPGPTNCRVVSGGVGTETRQSVLRAEGQKPPVSPQLSGVSGDFGQMYPNAPWPPEFRETLLNLAQAGHGLRLQGGRVCLDPGGEERKDLLPLAPVLEAWPGGSMTAAEVAALAGLLDRYSMEEVPTSCLQASWPRWRCRAFTAFSAAYWVAKDAHSCRRACAAIFAISRSDSAC